jgi:hypothetical protein
MDGQPGSIFSGTITPFVIDLTPVVGNYPTGPSELAAFASAAQTERLSSIAHARMQRNHERLTSYLRRAERASSEGDMKMARANYSLALRMADEPLKSMIQAKLKSTVASKQ